MANSTLSEKPKRRNNEVPSVNGAGEKLRESERLFRTLTEQSWAGIYVVQKGTFKFINTNAAAYAGYKPEEMLGQSCERIIHPEDRAASKKMAKEMLCGSRHEPYEFRIITREGRIRWIIETVAAITFDGRPAVLGNSMDISDKKNAEVALRETEQRLTSIIEFLPDATFAIDRKGKVIAWNRAIVDMTGIRAEDMLGKSDYEYALPFYGMRRPILIDLVLKPDKEIENKYLFLKRDPDLAIAEVEVEFPLLKDRKSILWGKACPLYDVKGDIEGAIESIRDITDFKRAHEKLRSTEARYQSLVEQIPAVTYISSYEQVGSIRYVSPQIESLLGVTKHEYKTNPTFWLEYIHPEDRDLVLSKITAWRSGTAKQFEVEYRVNTKDGQLKWVREEASLIRGQNSDPQFFQGVMFDITDRKRAEQELHKSEVRYRTIFNNTGSAMLIIKNNGIVSLVNTEFEKMFGCTKEEIENKLSWTDFVDKRDIPRLKGYFDLRFINPSIVPNQYEIKAINTKGQIKDVFLTVAIIPETTSRIVSVMDITERQQAQESMKQKSAELEQKTRELEELNTALKVLLQRQEKNQFEIEEKVLSNVKELVLPHLRKLKKRRTDVKDATDINIVEANLTSIISPFAQRLSSRALNLTHKEIQVADLIKEGKTTKEIAEYLGVSKSTIDTHRFNVRRKLGINNTKSNLRSRLTSFR